MQFADTLRRAGMVARAIIAIVLFVALMYLLLAVPGVLTDEASTLSLPQTLQGHSRCGARHGRLHRNTRSRTNRDATSPGTLVRHCRPGSRPEWT
jgi:hypothetical protein